MSKAHRVIEKLFEGAPTAPAPTRPGTKPAPSTRPGSKPGNPKHDPWRRREIKPGEAPRPKAKKKGEDEQALAENTSTLNRALEQIHRKFVEERVSGFTHEGTGKTYPPVSKEEAEARWTQRKPHPTRPGSLLPSPEMRFRRVLETDPEIRRKLGLDRPEPQRAEAPAAPPAQAAPPQDGDWTPPVAESRAEDVISRALGEARKKSAKHVAKAPGKVVRESRARQLIES